MTRPKWGPGRDENDWIVNVAGDRCHWQVHGDKIELVDTSPFRGLVDRVCSINGFMFGLEVKSDDKAGFTKGEKAFPGHVFVVITVEDVLAAFIAAYELSLTLMPLEQLNMRRPPTIKEVHKNE